MQLRTELIQIDQARGGIDGVGVDVEEVAGDVVAIAVSEVAAGVVVKGEQALIVYGLTDFLPVFAARLGWIFQPELG